MVVGSWVRVEPTEGSTLDQCKPLGRVLDLQKGRHMSASVGRSKSGGVRGGKQAGVPPGRLGLGMGGVGGEGGGHVRRSAAVCDWHLGEKAAAC